MKNILFLSLFFVVTVLEAKTLTLSRNVFKKVAFSSLYSESGALIKNIDYPSVNALIPQLNSLYNLELSNRGEAHITVVTPPEFQSELKKVFKVEEILERYRTNIQDIPFEVVCVGSRKSSKGKNHVFYLVVKAPELFALRDDLAFEGKLRAEARQTPLVFKPEAFWPHITIGYIKDDVFEFTKGPESCLPDVKLVIQ